MNNTFVVTGSNHDIAMLQARLGACKQCQHYSRKDGTIKCLERNEEIVDCRNRDNQRFYSLSSPRYSKIDSRKRLLEYGHTRGRRWSIRKCIASFKLGV